MLPSIFLEMFVKRINRISLTQSRIQIILIKNGNIFKQNPQKRKKSEILNFRNVDKTYQ